MPGNDPRVRARAASLALWLVNLAAAALIARAYLAHAPERASGLASLFVGVATISTLVLLTLPLALAFLALAGRFAESRAFAWVQACAWATVLFLLYADTRIYSLFRYHFNGMVWNLLTTPGGEDAFQLGPSELVLPLAAVVVWVAVELLLLARFRGDAIRPGALRFRPGWLAAGLCVPIVLVDKAIYARADLVRDREITVFARVFPYYAPITIKKVARTWFGVKLDERPKVDVGSSSRILTYPLARPTFAPDAPRPNVLVVVVDSLRADALDPTRMPNLTRFAEGGRVFADHLSGGNATRFGIFSLLYGLPGSYWDPAYEENCPPVLVDSLARLGYDLRVLSSASMSYPEFRSTAWVTMEDRVEDAFRAKETWKRDVAVTQRFDGWLGERAASAPFFAFVLLDAPHQRYSFDPAEAPFQPYETDLDYLEIADDDADPATREPIRNRFWNAVHFADRRLADLFASLERHGRAEDTVVIVTGDHGEEFWEHGYFGHTSNFTRAQTHVTFVMRGPGVPAGVETRPTSHLDVVPTLLELLGADPASRASYTTGVNLLAPPERRARNVAGWQELALVLDDGIVYVPLGGYRGGAEAYGFDWRPHPEGDDFLRAHGAETAELARDCRRFLR
ncbi:MAG: sulfatase-like hydrolase/transferase [Planctomycetes bacterium]|nr:sulfatase-like hydrolase/transferase [Planctomycetota bacterium]